MFYTAYQTVLEPGPYAQVQWFLMLHVCALLIARSILQALAGASGLRDAEGGASRALTRYTTFGVVSALAVGGLLVAITRLGGWDYYYWKPLRMMGMVGLLLAWPLVLRRFHRRRQARRSWNDGARAGALCCDAG